MTGATINAQPGPRRRLEGSGRPLPTVAVFEKAPDLLRRSDGDGFADLMRVRTAVLSVEPGRWRPPGLRADARCHYGLLVLDGVLLRQLSLNGHTGAELLGAGDLLQPWVRQPPYETLAVEPGWRILEPTRLAVLDGHFAARVASWPEVAAALLARATERARTLAFQHVASHIPGLEARLVALMWSLADRWGRVTPAGILIPLGLTHATLAELVGASRPSVSSALSQLARAEVLARHPGGWLLDEAARIEPLSADGAAASDPPARLAV